MKKTGFQYRVTKLLEKLYEQIDLEGFKEEDLQTFCTKFLLACFHENVGLFAGFPLKSSLSQPTSMANYQLEELLKFVPPYQEYSFTTLSDKTFALLREIAGLDWAKIPVETVGMFYQLSMSRYKKEKQNAYYTTRQNIRRTVDELFVTDLEHRVNEALTIGDFPALLKLKKEISAIKVLDASCGTGNYLIVIYEILYSLDAQICQALNTTITVSPEQMYGIEIDKSACELAKILLWTTNRMCEIKYASITRTDIPYLDVSMNYNIINADAISFDWNQLIPAEKLTYIVGNPPFSFNHSTNMFAIKRTDFSACWIKKSTEMMKLNPKIEASLLVNNSVCQGEQVYYIWKSLMNKDGIVINFAHKNFMWEQALGDDVQVAVIVIGFSKVNRKHKKLYVYENSFSSKLERIENVDFINAYLENLPSVFLNTSFPYNTSRPRIWSCDEVTLNTISSFERNPNSYYKLVANAGKFLEGIFEYLEVTEQPQKSDTIIIPRTSSAKRDYFPILFLENESVTGNYSVLVIHNASLHLFALLSTRLHKLWGDSFSGHMLKLSLRYSKLTYDTFPIPKLTDEQIKKLEKYAKMILNERKNTNLPIGKIYLNMPSNLRRIHLELDNFVEQIYFSTPFLTSKQKLEKLVNMYNEATKDIPYQLIDYRTEFDYSVHELATFLGISDETYALSETKNRMGDANLKKLSQLYDVDYETLRKTIKR